MARIDENTIKDFQDGEYIHDVDLDQTFEILRTAINDNYDQLTIRYTKAEIDQLLRDLEAGIATGIQLVDVLPNNTIQGTFCMMRSDNKIYYYTGTTWLELVNTDSLDVIIQNIEDHKSNKANPHDVTYSQVGAIPIGEKGNANGVATLDENGKLMSEQSPYVTGTYTGDGTASRTINLGFEPSAIFVHPSEGMYVYNPGSGASYYGGFATKLQKHSLGTASSDIVAIVSDGFTVHFKAETGYSIQTNRNTNIYNYIAWR